MCAHIYSGYTSSQYTLHICRSSGCDSNVNAGIIGGMYWVEKGHMVLEATGGQASDSICHGVLTVSHCPPVPAHWSIQ